MERKKKLADALLCVSAIAMIVTGVLLISALGGNLRGMAYWQNVARMKETMGEWTGQNILPRYQSLYEANPDIVGWLTIEGTNYLDLPVMQTKNEPEHYLRRNFDDEADPGGTPFADWRCDVVPVKGFNTVIYGHDSAFQWLTDYEYKYWRTYQEHRIIRFDTLNGEALYEVAAVFYLDARDVELLDPWDPEHPQAYECYNYLEVDSPEGFQKFLDSLAERRLYGADAEITLESHIITLIRCAREPYSGIPETDGAVNGRLVVVAVSVPE